MVGVGIAEHHLEVLQRGGDAFVGPGRRTIPQAPVLVGAAGAGQDILQGVHGLPAAGRAQGQGHDACGLERLGNSGKLLKGGRRRHTRLVHERLVVPQHVGAVDVDRDAPVVAAVGLEQRQQVWREGLLQPFGGIDVVEGRQVLLGAVALDLQTGVELEGVGRVAGDEPGLVHGLEVAARATGHRGVHDLDVGVLLLVDLEHAGQALGLAAGRPPTADHELARFAASIQVLGLAGIIGRPGRPRHPRPTGRRSTSRRRSSRGSRSCRTCPARPRRPGCSRP